MAVQQALTLEQFMSWQSRQGMKHEYDRGRVIPHIVAMPGGTESHNRIEANLFRELANSFEESSYLPLTSNQLIATADGEVGYFPDAVLLDGDPVKIRYGNQHAATNPAVVFEIASANTREYDHGRKLEVYRSIPTMREVFLIESGEARIVRHYRIGAGWEEEEIVGLDASMSVLGVRIPLARLYRKVELPPV